VIPQKKINNKQSKIERKQKMKKSKKMSKNNESVSNSEMKRQFFEFFMNVIPQSLVDELNLSKTDVVTIYESYFTLLPNLLTDFEDKVSISLEDYILLMSEYSIRIPKIRKVLDTPTKNYFEEMKRISDLVKLTFDILPETIDDVLFNSYVWRGYLGISENGVEIVRYNTYLFNKMKDDLIDTDFSKEVTIEWLNNELVENPSVFKSLIEYSEYSLKCIKGDGFSLISYDDFGKKLISDIENLQSFNFENLPSILNTIVFELLMNVFRNENCKEDVECYQKFLNDTDFS